MVIITKKRAIESTCAQGLAIARKQNPHALETLSINKRRTVLYLQI